MSVGPAGGILGSAAGVPLSQTKGSETVRAAQETADRQRRVENDKKATNAAGIAEVDGEEHDVNDRDADGRWMWEKTPNAGGGEGEEDDEQPGGETKDATSPTGNQVDLSG